MFGETNKVNLDLIKKCFSGAKQTKMSSLVKQLIQRGVVNSEKVCNVLIKVDRGDFIDSSYAYLDSAQDINYGATISAPHMHALALEYLENHLKPGNKVLDVGSGSGYLCAAFSKMMDDQGTVVGVEHIPELYKKGVENLSKSYKNLINDKKIILKEGDGRKGCQDYAPYDCIHVGAACEKVPAPLVEQLKPGGRLMIPVGKYYQFIYLIDKDEKGKLTQDAVLSVRYVPLTDKEKQLAKSESNVYGFWEL